MCDYEDPLNQIVHMKKIQAEGLELFIKKNADYGSSYKQYGLIGVLVRLQDKINRALHITQNGIHVKDETLRDTLIDLHNYAAMALMESDQNPKVPDLLNKEYQNPTVPSLPRNSSESSKTSTPLTPVERASLPVFQQVRSSISDPVPRSYDEIYDECNNRNINLR